MHCLWYWCVNVVVYQHLSTACYNCFVLCVDSIIIIISSWPQGTWLVGPKITLWFPRLLIYILCASALITCTIITSRILLPCDLTSRLWQFRLLLCVAAMSRLCSLPQLQLRDGYHEEEAT